MAETTPNIASSQEDPLVGKVLDFKYLVGNCLGKGGYGTVYSARSIALDAEVALKLLSFSDASDAKRARRFIAEATALASLSHPNIVKVLASSVDNAHHAYMALELVRGKSLQQLVIEAGPLNEEQFESIFTQVCDGLSHAHGVGIVHRDIKPSNLMISEPGDVKILDFGISKLVNDDQRLTRTGEIVGSPQYISPEQCSSRPADVRSDIYSLGCTMYFALTGKCAFAGDSAMEVLLKHLNETADLDAVPNKYRALVGTCLEKQPADRFQTVEAVASALRDGWQPTRVSKPPLTKFHRHVIVIAAAITVGAVVAGFGLNTLFKTNQTAKSSSVNTELYLERLIEEMRPRIPANGISQEDLKKVDDAAAMMRQSNVSPDIEERVLWHAIWTNGSVGHHERQAHYFKQLDESLHRVKHAEYGATVQYALLLDIMKMRGEAIELLRKNIKWFNEVGQTARARRLKYDLMHLYRLANDEKNLAATQRELAHDPEEADFLVLQMAVHDESKDEDTGSETARRFLEAPHSAKYPGLAAMANNIIGIRTARAWAASKAKPFYLAAKTLAEQGLSSKTVSQRQKELCDGELYRAELKLSAFSAGKLVRQ